MTEQQLEYFRKYRRKHAVKLRKYQKAYQTAYNAVRRRKYRLNAEYRAKELERKARTRTHKQITRLRDSTGRFTRTITN